MNQYFKKNITAAACFSIIASISFAQSAPKETLTASITRTASSPQTSVVRLTKNQFRTESYQAPYIVQVPYQATETYQVEVPYEVEVPYTDYETEYRQEEQCQNVTRYRDEYRCETVTRYRDEYRCEDRTSYRQECRNEQQCYIVPGSGGEQCHDVTECGTNALGQQICKTRRVCEQGQPQQRCENRQVCENVPYTDRQCHNVSVPYTDQDCRNVSVPYTDRQCQMVNVPYQRPVTKYRTETRTRTEDRTRTVTKYRDEERCCETRTREVFDKQLEFQVEVVFPNAAVLAANETETLDVTLATLQPASISLSTKNTIYGYEVLSQSNSGAVISVNLKLKPRYDLSNAGEKSITDLRITSSAQLNKFVVTVDDSISDSAIAQRLQTVSSIEVRDLITDQLIEEQPVSVLVNGKKGIVLQTQLDPQSKLKAILKVKRSGILVAGGLIEFTKIATFEKRTVATTDVQGLSDAKLLTLTAGNTSGLDATMILTDLSEEFADVTTKYNVYSMELLANDQRTNIGVATVTRDQLKAANNELNLKNILGAKAGAYLVKGKTLRFHIEVIRTGPKTVVKSPISLLVKASTKIK